MPHLPMQTGYEQGKSVFYIFQALFCEVTHISLHHFSQWKRKFASWSTFFFYFTGWRRSPTRPDWKHPLFPGLSLYMLYDGCLVACMHHLMCVRVRIVSSRLRNRHDGLRFYKKTGHVTIVNSSRQRFSSTRVAIYSWFTAEREVIQEMSLLFLSIFGAIHSECYPFFFQLSFRA